MAEPGRAIRIYAPVYGSVRTVVLFGLLVQVVERATEALVETLQTVAPSVSSAPLEFVLAAVLWVVLALVALAEFRRQTADNPHEFLAIEVALAFLDQRRLAPRGAVLAILLTAGGIGVSWVARPRFVATLDGGFQVLTALVETGSPGAFDMANLVWGVAFVGGVLVLAWGLDRLVIGLLREVRYRRYRLRGT